MTETERSSRPSTEGTRSSRPSAPPTRDEEPPSRAPQLPPEPDPKKPAHSHRQGPGGTVRMMRGDPAPPGRNSAPRVSQGSLYPERKSRLSVLRETLLSVLPPIPKSLEAISTPILLLVGLFGLAASVVVLLALTGRLPEGFPRFGLGDPAPKSEAWVPPPLSDIVEVDEELGLPSAEPGRDRLGRGVLSIPKTFTAKQDGAFDLVVHFHGNTDLAIESYEVSLLDTVVLVLNLGNGSGAYETRFQNPAEFDKILERVPAIVSRRGLKDAHIRRIALVGWSAGYGAIIKILLEPRQRERVDAVVLLDGLHASYRAGTTLVESAPIEGALLFAEQAARGEKLMLLTHSEIRPDGYLGVKETVDHLLVRVELERTARSAETVIPGLKAAHGVLPRAELRPLSLTSEARKQGLVVRGYAGQEAAHHISHLMQMSAIALPELGKRWQSE